MPIPSTFSIVAFDPDGPAWGVAVASKFLAVGAVVPWARAGAGAVATQSYANTSFGSDGLNLMESGVAADEALQKMISQDPDAQSRQVGLVDAQGRAATFTGKSCFEWAGGLTGDGFAVQGNILAGEQVIQAMAETFVKRKAESIIWRLYYALLAGDRAGGDRRGKQSAALLVVKAGGGYAGFNDRWVDYRVDDHADPVIRLGELLELHELYMGKSPPDGRIKLSGESLVQLQQIMKVLGYYPATPDGVYDFSTRTALRAFIGNENFEERTDFEDGWIDRPVFEYLLKRFK